MQMRAEFLFFCSSLAQNKRRKTAAHFDDQPWLKMPNHAVSHEGINTIEKTVPKIEPIVLLSFSGWELLIFVTEL